MMSAPRKLVGSLILLREKDGLICGPARYEDNNNRYQESSASATVDLAMTGDEAYQRRLALSRGQVEDPAPPPQAETGDEAYHRHHSCVLEFFLWPIMPMLLPEWCPICMAMIWCRIYEEMWRGRGETGSGSRGVQRNGGVQRSSGIQYVGKSEFASRRLRSPVHS